MSNIYGFIHNMNTEYGSAILYDQLNKVEDIGLAESSKFIYVGIVGEDIKVPLAQLHNLFSCPFPLALIHHSCDISKYEGHTLNALWELSFRMDPDDMIWYIHSKGASASGQEKFEQASYWRNKMEDVVLNQWFKCTKLLSLSMSDGCPLYDAYGSHYFSQSDTEKRKFIPGNFWWTTAKFIQSLPSPSDWLVKSGTLGTERERFAYETWLGHSRENIHLGGQYEWNDFTSPQEATT